MLLFCHGNTFSEEQLGKMGSLKSVMTATVTSFLCQPQQNFVLLFVIPRSISVQNLSKIGQETKKLHKIGNDVIVTSFLKIAQQFFVHE